MKYNVKAKDLFETINKINQDFINMHAHDIAKQTVDNAPASTGLLKGSITLSVNSPLPEYGDLDKSGTATKQNIDSVELNIGDVAYINAGAPYALYVEQGSSTQAPNGFMRLAISDAQRLADEAARKL